MRRNSLIFLLSFAVLSSCGTIDEGNINDFDHHNTAEMDEMIVVQGGVTSELRRHKVVLAMPAVWNSDSLAMPKINAVYVTCETDTFPYRFLEMNFKKEAVYQSDSAFKGIVGKTYKLVVETEKKVVTAEDKLVPLNDTSSFDIVKRVAEYEEETFSMPRHIFCLSKQPLAIGINTRYNLSPENGLSDMTVETLFNRSFVHSDLSLQAMFSSSEFSYSYYYDGNKPLEIITHSVSPAYYEYLVSVFNESDWSMGVFSMISGNVSTNVKNGYGYFYAADIRRELFDSELFVQ
ncbi:MAG: DUF4249 family protein [Candidatus Limimorpha sp.]